MRSVEQEPRQPLTRGYRSLVEFSIELRYEGSFRLVIADLRKKWGIYEMGDNFRTKLVEERALRPVIHPYRLDDSWEWAWWGPYPATIKTPFVDDFELAGDYRTDVAQLLDRFVPYQRFPFVCFPGEEMDPTTAADPSPPLPRNQVGRHPLSSFFSLCVLYEIEALPADAGIAPPAFFGDSPNGGRFIVLPPDTTKEDAYRIVNAEFERGPDFLWRSSEAVFVGRQRPATRSLDAVMRTYETYRLRRGGMTIAEIGNALVETGLEDKPPLDTTLRKRIAAAVQEWRLPSVAYCDDE